MNYTTITLVAPTAYQQAANNCAHVFDFDVGGAETFNHVGLSADGSGPATHYMAHTAIRPHYIPVLTDPVQAMTALTSLAQQYGREAPAEQDVLEFCANVEVSEAGADPWAFVDSLGLKRIFPDEPAA